MATKKMTKRTSKSIAGDECRAKIACKHNVFDLIDGEATQQAMPISYATNQAEFERQTTLQLTPSFHSEDEGGELKLQFAPQRYIVYNKFRGVALVHICEYAMKTPSSAIGVCEHPTKKGVCFTPGRLFIFRSKVD